LGDLELKFAKEKNLQIKLLAYAQKRNDNEVAALVIPKFVKSTDTFSTVNDVFNGVKVQTAFADKQFFYGRGAGSLPTQVQFCLIFLLWLTITDTSTRKLPILKI
jgi:homoserine dehydrogenase